MRDVQKHSTEVQKTCEEQRNRILNAESVNAVLKSEIESLQGQHRSSLNDSTKREEILKQQVGTSSIMFVAIEDCGHCCPVNWSLT